jgi:hypothetical protein
MSSKTTLGLNLIKSLNKKPKGPDIDEPEPIEEVSVATDDAAAAKRRKKKVGIRGGQQSTVLSGIQSALKKRLGE